MKKDLCQLAQSIGITKPCPEELLQFYAQMTIPEGDACDIKLIEELQREFSLFGEYYQNVLQVALAVNQDPDRSLWVKVAAAYSFVSTQKECQLIPVPDEDGSEISDFLPLLILLQQIPASIENYRSRGFSEKELKKLLASYAGNLRLVEGKRGRPGLDRIQFNWLNLFAKAEIFYVGSLQFQLFRLPANSLWLRNRVSGEMLPVMMAGTFHKSGIRYLGRPGYEDPESAFTVTYSEDDENFYGHGVYDAVVSAQQETFLKSQWECLIRPGDKCLFMHIPKGADISVASATAACRQAIKIARERYPDEAADCIFCCSWLLDPTNERLLGAGSKIAAFGRCFSRRPCADGGMNALRFIYPKSYPDFETLPEETSLQRKVKNLYLNGDRLYEYYGIFEE